MPVILCVGSDLIIMDCLAPLVGTLLIDKYKINTFVYGTLKNTITAKEIVFAKEFINKYHKGKKVLAVDAAVGKINEIGLVKISGEGLYPGLGVNKRLPMVGDISILGIVSDKSFLNKSMLAITRMNLIYKMANLIAEAIASAI